MCPTVSHHCPALKKKRIGRRPKASEVRRAAALCFADEMNDEEIAAKLGICRRTLARWKHRSSFRTEVETLQEEFRRKMDAERRRLEERLERRLADPYGMAQWPRR